MPINAWPEAERPREKLLAKGPAALSNAELLAIFLRTGINGKTAVDLARDLLLDFGDLRLLIEADVSALCRTRGLGPAKYVQIQAAIELGKRYLEAGLRHQDVLTPARKRPGITC